MSTPFSYYAFISYSSKDTKWGKRVQRKLEGYRMPAALCSERGWERTPIKPVFFAPADIQPGGLSEELQERLRASQHLVVICSPHAARSEWVGREIAFFHSLGRTKNIHLFIVDGIPHSGNSRTECFHPVIRELGMPDMLGANIHEKIYRCPRLNRERAYVQLVSKLLDVEFDTIWQRHRRLLRQRIAAWSAGLLAVLATLFGVWLAGQPVDVQVEVDEVSVPNPALPPLAGAVVTMTLDNETKTDTLVTAAGRVRFPNIPRRSLGKPVHILVACRDFLPVDTTCRLTKQLQLPLRRDPSVYGAIRFRLWDPEAGQSVAGMQLRIGGHEVTTDAAGRGSLFVPLAEQQTSYPVTAPVPLETDRLYMPCGDQVHLLLQPARR